MQWSGISARKNPVKLFNRDDTYATLSTIEQHVVTEIGKHTFMLYSFDGVLVTDGSRILFHTVDIPTTTLRKRPQTRVKVMISTPLCRE
jgi:hypothetical protein